MIDVTWIKLDTELFNNKKIKKIRRMPDGDKILLIWIYLLTHAGKSNARGFIYITDEVPVDNDDIAVDLNYDVSIVHMALETFKKLNMIDIDNDFISISNWGEYQSVDRLEEIKEKNRLRQQRYRDNQKLLNSSINIKKKNKSKKEIERNNAYITLLKNTYGELNNVLLTEDEYNRLIKDFGIKIITKYINSLSLWAKFDPKTNHNLTIRSWLNKDDIPKFNITTKSNLKIKSVHKETPDYGSYNE